MQTSRQSDTDFEQGNLFEIPADAQARLQAQAIEDEKLGLMLPDCPGQKRQMPNEVVRSALFCAKNRKVARPFYRQEKLPVIGGGEITYTGEELRQDDEVVWMHLIHLAANVPIGTPVEFTSYEFLKGIGKAINKNNYQWLHSSLTRMQATAVQFFSKRLNKGVSASLVTEFKWEGDAAARREGVYRVGIDATMRQLFDNATWLDWEKRSKISEGIATKLMSFWSSHRNPLPEKVEVLKTDLCKLTSSTYEFNRGLRAALDELVAAGFLKSYVLHKGVVSVIRELGASGHC